MKIITLIAMLLFTLPAFGQRVGNRAGSTKGDPLPESCVSLNYTHVSAYEFAQAHAHSNLTALDVISTGRTFVGPTGTTGDTFLGNVIDVQTLDGCDLRLWYVFCGPDLGESLVLVSTLPGHRDITITYDMDCGMVTLIQFR